MVGDPEVKSIKTFATTVRDCTDFRDRLSRFSVWKTLLKVVAKIIRLFKRPRCHTNVVAVKEREGAAKAVIKLVQQQAFNKEITLLEAGESLPSSSSLWWLDPFLKEGLLLVGGRLKHSSFSEEFKHLLILPKDSHVTQLIISYCHQ